MKILMAVASRHGSTREIAEAVAKALRAYNLDVDLQDVRAVRDLKGYDALILGSAIYAGNWLPEAKQFAERNRAQLAQLPVWLFSSGPVGVPPKPDEDPARFAESMGDVPARDHHIFVGKLDPDTLSFPERLIVKALRVQTGDFREWEDIQQWSQNIAQVLLVESSLTAP